MAANFSHKIQKPFDEMRLQSKCSKISHNYKLSHLEDEYMYDFCWYAKKNKNKIKIREVVQAYNK